MFLKREDVHISPPLLLSCCLSVDVAAGAQAAILDYIDKGDMPLEAQQ